MSHHASPPSTRRLTSASPTPARLATAATAALAATAAIAAIAAPASADPVEFSWFGPDNYAIRLSHMPDFDQRRVEGGNPVVLGLPGGGNMYCVPTSVTNLAAYAANHGFPDTLEPTWWQGQAAYPFVTEVLRILGILGGTTTSGGTNLGGMHTQAQALFSPALFTITVDGASFWWAPRVQDLAEMVHQGGIVSFCHGWYAFNGNLVERNGGHCITMTRAYEDASRQEVWARDPADDAGNSSQSAFVERMYTFEDSLYVTLDDGIKVMSRIFSGPGDTAVRLIDGYCMVKPRWAATFLPGGTGLQINFAAQFFADLPLQQTVDLPDNVSAVITGPLQDTLYAAGISVTGGPALFCSDIVDAQWIQLPIPMPPQAQLQLANDRCLLAVGGGEAIRVLLDAEVPDIIASVPVPANGRMAYDAENGRLVVLDPAAGRIFLFDDDLEGGPQLVSIPGGAGLPADASVVWDDTRGGLWFADPRTPTVLTLARPVAGTPIAEVEEVTIPGLIDPEFVQVDGMGHLVLLDEGILKEFMVQDDGTWQRNADSPFDGLESDGMPILSRSRTNYDPEIHDVETWRNVLPETFAMAVPDCDADLDFDGVVGFSDLVMALAAFGDCPPGEYCDGDLDGDGQRGFSDIVMLLAAWGVCD